MSSPDTPLAVGTATFVVTVTDSAGNSASKAFSIAITMPCFLVVVEMLLDNCAEVVEGTEDFGPTSALFSAIARPGLTTTPDCTNTSVTPAGLTNDCTVLTSTHTAVGFSPATVNPALTDALFATSHSESVTVTEAGNGSCTVSRQRRWCR